MADDFDRIKRNVQKMIAANAPVDDIDGYLKTERLSADEFGMVASGKIGLGSLRMTQKSQGEIAKIQSRGQTMPSEGIHRGTMLPMSKVEATGENYFDPDAGLLGVVKRAVMTPGDVAMGNLNPESPEGIRRTAEMGMTFTPMGPGVRAAEAIVPGSLKSLKMGTPKVPTIEELKAAASSGFTQARNLGVDYSADSLKSLGDDITRSLEAEGFFAETAPKTFSLLSRVKQPPEGSVASLDNFITLRKSLQKAAGDFSNPTEQAAASRVISAIDEFLVAADPKSVVAGPASSVPPIINDARGNYAAAKRSEDLSGAITQAEIDAAAANSGLNLDNRTRQLLNSILKNDKRTRGYSKEELAVLERAVRGDFGANLARYVGNLFGGGGGLGSAMTSMFGSGAGYLLGGMPGAVAGAGAPAAIGMTARKIGAGITQRAAKDLDEMLRMRSPLYEQNKQNAPVLENLRPEARAMVLRALQLIYGRENETAPTGAR